MNRYHKLIKDYLTTSIKKHNENSLCFAYQISRYLHQMLNRLFLKNFEADKYDAKSVIAKALTIDPFLPSSLNKTQTSFMKSVIGKDNLPTYKRLRSSIEKKCEKYIVLDDTDLNFIALQYLTFQDNDQFHLKFSLSLKEKLIEYYLLLQSLSIETKEPLIFYRGVNVKKGDKLRLDVPPFTYVSVSEDLSREFAGETNEYVDSYLMKIEVPVGVRIFPLLLFTNAVDQFEFLILESGRLIGVKNEEYKFKPNRRETGRIIEKLTREHDESREKIEKIPNW